VMWFNAGGNRMTEEEWTSPFVRCLGMLLSGDATDVLNVEGESVRDDTFLLLINADHEAIAFVLPGQEHLEWQLILDTSNTAGFCDRTEKICLGRRCRSRRASLLFAATGRRQASSGTRRIVEKAASRLSAVHRRGRTRGTRLLTMLLHIWSTHISGKRDVATA